MTPMNTLLKVREEQQDAVEAGGGAKDAVGGQRGSGNALKKGPAGKPAPLAPATPAAPSLAVPQAPTQEPSALPPCQHRYFVRFHWCSAVCGKTSSLEARNLTPHARRRARCAK